MVATSGRQRVSESRLSGHTAARVAAVAARVAAVRAVRAAPFAALQEADVAVALRLLTTVVHFAPTAARPRAALGVADAAASARTPAAVRQAAVRINSLTVAFAAGTTPRQNRRDAESKAGQRHHNDSQALQTSTHHDSLSSIATPLPCIEGTAGFFPLCRPMSEHNATNYRRVNRRSMEKVAKISRLL
jgi:hypothetical protein